MKLQVTQQNLSKALNITARVANTRNTLPILSNILLKTVGNRLSVAATNLDIAITNYVGSKIEQKGAVTVPARLMQDFITSLPEGILSLELQENKLKITTDQYHSTINGIAADDFPVMPTISGGTPWAIAAQELKKSLQQVVFAAGSDDSRPVLTGVYFHSNDGEVYIVATDSYRLAEKKLGKHRQAVSLLIPAGATQDLLRIISDADEQVKIMHDEQQVLFEVGDTSLVARLIDGKYPDYKKLIPAKFSTVAMLKREDFNNITKVSSLFARESAGSITIKASQAQNQVSINSIASQLGENTASAPAEVSSDGEVTLNSRYLMDGLNAFTSEDVEFCFNGKLEPCVLRSQSEPNYVSLVMPLRS